MMLENDVDLSSLKTVSSFDIGSSSTMAVGLPQNNFSPSSLLVESLIEQICKFLDKDPRNQRKLYLTVCGKLHQMNLIGTSYNKEEFQFMRSHYQNALYNLLAVSKSTTIDKKAISPFSNIIEISLPPDLFELSRYSTEFIELGFIAKGGFGNVFKVQHKLDGGIYAVKKIFLRYRSRGFLNNLNEVKTLAQLYHPNIVAYKAAWLEHVNLSLIMFGNKIPIQNYSRSSSSISSAEYKNVSIKDDSLEVVFEKSSQVISEVSTKNGSSGRERNELALCDFMMGDNCKSASQLRRNEWAVLYIQMQLCHATLRQWMDKRNQNNEPVDTRQCLYVLKQVTSGLEYIHSKNIVHHDIKPSNIFVSEDLKEVQLGDFGLACNLLTHSPLVEVASHGPGQIGTELYSAPEQLKGQCNPKSDVYSLGIVLFELIHPFKTSMERSKVISKLKSGHIPPQIYESAPLLVKILKGTICNDCKKRPTSGELLAALSDIENEETKKCLKDQEETILQLRKESLAKDQQIAFLQEQLRKFMEKDS